MYFVYLLTLLILINHLWGYLKARHPLIVVHPLNLPILLFFLSQLISTLISVNPNLSWFGYYSRLNGGLLSTLAYLLLFIIAVVHFTPTEFFRLLRRSTLLASLPVVAYALAQHFGIDSNYWVQDVKSRVFSTFGQPNWLATYLGIVLAFALNQTSISNNVVVRRLSPLYPVLIIIAIIFTQSKTGLAAAALIIGLTFILQIGKTKITQLVSYPLLFIFLILVTPNFLSQKLFPASPQDSPQVPVTQNVTSSGDIRLIVWQGALSLWRQYPLFGTGPETFADTYYWVRPTAHNLTSEWDFLYNKAHNEYLNYAANTGTFGILSYLSVLLVTLLLIIRSRQWVLLVAYLSLLVNHATGFSIVISSLYLFLIPAAISWSKPVPTPPTKPSTLVYLPLLVALVFLLPKIVLFYLADLSYAQALKQSGAGQYPSALTQIELAASLRPNFPEYLINLSVISAQNALSTTDASLQNKYYLTATQASDKALTLSPSSLNYWKLSAQTSYYLKDFNPNMLKLATTRLTKVAKLAPTDARLFFLIGEFQLEQKDYSAAQSSYQTALNLKSNYDHASFRLAQINFLNKNYPRAKKMLELTLQLAPTNIDAQDLLKKLPPNSN
jgi:O-antigen ligase/Flp pilus assembly protein TadD